MINTVFTTTYLVVVHAIEVAVSRLARDEQGQASAEYALVLLGAALLAILLGGWLTQGDTLKRLFGEILAKILGDMPK